MRLRVLRSHPVLCSVSGEYQYRFSQIILIYSWTDTVELNASCRIFCQYADDNINSVHCQYSIDLGNKEIIALNLFMQTSPMITDSPFAWSKPFKPFDYNFDLRLSPAKSKRKANSPKKFMDLACIGD